jgi:molybdopterin-binding protein
VRISIRNQLAGEITEVKLGAVMAAVKIRLDGSDQVITSSITKSTEVAIGVD